MSLLWWGIVICVVPDLLVTVENSFHFLQSPSCDEISIVQTSWSAEPIPLSLCSLLLLICANSNISDTLLES